MCYTITRIGNKKKEHTNLREKYQMEKTNGKGKENPLYQKLVQE